MSTDTTNEKTPPRLCDGLAVIPVAEGLLIEGGPRRHLFRGRAATSLLPTLLPLLDGRNDVAQVCALADIAPSHLDQALTMLDGCGLLDHTASQRPMAARRVMPEQTAGYLSRTLGMTGCHRATDDLCTTLDSAAVLLTGATAVMGPLAMDLKGSGVGTVELVSSVDEAFHRHSAAVSAAEHGLVIVHDDPAVPERLENVIRAAGPHADVLRVAHSSGNVEIGPRFRGAYPACPACLRRGRAELGWATSSADRDTAEVALLQSLAVAEALAVLAHVHEPSPPQALARISMDDQAVERYPLTADHSCATCRGMNRPGEPEMAETYEWQVRRRLSEPQWQKRRLKREVDRLVDLQKERPEFPTSPRIRLPAQQEIPPVKGFLGEPRGLDSLPSCGLDATLLAGVLMRVAGRRWTGKNKGSLRRWAPSGGNQASVEAYVLGTGRIFDRPETCFRYDDLTHELVVVQASTTPLHQHLAGTDLNAEGLDAVIVLVAGVGRLALKYTKFAYRLAHLDAGCAALQLAAVTTGYGLELELATSWDDRLAAELELDGDSEIITAIAGIQTPAREEYGRAVDR